MIKSKILALALIGIILSSSSLSVADAYTISLNIHTTPLAISHPQIYKINLFDHTATNNEKKFAGSPALNQINLVDGISADLSESINGMSIPYQVNLVDGILSIFNNFENPELEKFVNTKFISISLDDGIGSKSTKYNQDDTRIVLIKENDDRKALWERIFPLDRIRNGIKSFYKIIQNDHSLSYIQLEEVSSNNNQFSINQLPTIDSELQNLSEFEKFVGKTAYVTGQLVCRYNSILMLKSSSAKLILLVYS